MGAISHLLPAFAPLSGNKLPDPFTVDIGGGMGLTAVGDQGMPGQFIEPGGFYDRNPLENADIKASKGSVRAVGSVNLPVLLISFIRKGGLRNCL